MSNFIDIGPCCRCKQDIQLPLELYHAAKRSPNISFWCAYGHQQHFAEGETNETKLRRERDRLAQQIAQRDDEIRRQRELGEAAERQVSAARGQVTKLKNRASAGVCPCCNRSFPQLRRHMETKHPTFKAGAANVIPIERAKA